MIAFLAYCLAAFVVFLAPRRALLVFIFLIPCEDLLMLVPGVTWLKLLGPLLLIELVLRKGLTGIKVSFPLRVLFGWLLLGGISLLWSIRPEISFGRFLTELQLYGLVLVLVSSLDTEKRIRHALMAFGMGSLVLGLFGLYASWAALGSVYGRAIAVAYESETTFAALAGTGAVVFLGFLWTGQKKYIPLYLLCVAVSALAVFAAAGRGALVGVVVIAAFLVLQNRSYSKSVLLGAGFIVLVLLAWRIGERTGLISDIAKNRMTIEHVVRTGGSNRVAIQKGFLLYVFPSRPLLGHGLNTAFLAYGATPEAVALAGSSFRDPHSSLLEILIDLGLLGLIYWLMLYGYLFWSLHRRRGSLARLEDMASLRRVALSLLLYTLMTGLTVTHLWEKYVWFTLAVAIAVKSTAVRHRTCLIRCN